MCPTGRRIDEVPLQCLGGLGFGLSWLFNEDPLPWIKVNAKVGTKADPKVRRSRHPLKSSFDRLCTLMDLTPASGTTEGPSSVFTVCLGPTTGRPTVSLSKCRYNGTAETKVRPARGSPKSSCWRRVPHRDESPPVQPRGLVWSGNLQDALRPVDLESHGKQRHETFPATTMARESGDADGLTQWAAFVSPQCGVGGVATPHEGRGSTPCKGDGPK